MDAGARSEDKYKSGRANRADPFQRKAFEIDARSRKAQSRLDAKQKSCYNSLARILSCTKLELRHGVTRTALTAGARYNRISALLVALLYVFFTTFGAVAHTHAFVEPSRKALAEIGAQPGHSASAVDYCVSASQRDCAACEWQALSVTQVSAPQPSIASALLHLVPTVPVFAFDAVAIARSSSRAPPAA